MRAPPVVNDHRMQPRRHETCGKEGERHVDEGDDGEHGGEGGSTILLVHRLAQHEVGGVEQADDEKVVRRGSQAHQTPQAALPQIMPVAITSRLKSRPRRTASTQPVVHGLLRAQILHGGHEGDGERQQRASAMGAWK